MDTPLAILGPDLDTQIGHYIIAAILLISFVLWIFSHHGTGLRKVAAIGLGGAISLAAFVVLNRYFPPGPIPPGAMP